MLPRTAVSIDRLLLRQQGCLTRQQAVASGMAEHEIRERLRSGAWQSVHNGVLHDLGHDDERWRLHAALLTQSTTGGWPHGVALSHCTAAGIYGFDGVPNDPRVHIVVPRDWIPKHRLDEVALHRCRTPEQHLKRWHGLPVTSATWTALSLIRVLPVRRALVVADAALLSGRCTLAQLHAALPLLAGLRGCVLARTVVDLARERTDSCQETETRFILVDGGLPQPDVDMRIPDESGRLIARGELGYRRKLIWLEYDGFAVHTDRQVFRSDRTRQNWLVNRGWFVLRYTDHDVFRAQNGSSGTPAPLCARRRAGSPPCRPVCPLRLTRLATTCVSDGSSGSHDHDDVWSVSSRIAQLRPAGTS